MYEVRFVRSADKELRKLPAQIGRTLTKRIAALAEDPRPAGCLKLKGFSDLWRIRSGDYRVIYRIDDGVLVVQVIKVSHRSDAYE